MLVTLSGGLLVAGCGDAGDVSPGQDDVGVSPPAGFLGSDAAAPPEVDAGPDVELDVTMDGGANIDADVEPEDTGPSDAEDGLVMDDAEVADDATDASDSSDAAPDVVDATPLPDTTDAIDTTDANDTNDTNDVAPDVGPPDIAPPPDCAALDDDDLCNGELVLEDGACVTAQESVVTCDDTDDPDCLISSCVPSTGECVLIPNLQPGLCDDQDPCTTDLCDSDGDCAHVVIEDCLCPAGASACQSWQGTGVASWLSSLTVAAPSPAPACCFDYTGDGVPDNRLGEVISNLASLTGHVPDLALYELVLTGDLTRLLTYDGLDSLAGDTVVGVTMHDGYSAADHDMRLGGEAWFSALTSVAKTSPALFSGAVDADGLEAGPAALTLPAVDLALGTTVLAPIAQARLAGAISLGDNDAGLTITDGRIGGVVSVTWLLDRLNDVLGGCDCLALTPGAVLFELAGQDLVVCTPEFLLAPGTCLEASHGPVCASLDTDKDEWCTALTVTSPDVDTDGSGVPDAYSIGYRFEAVSANVAGSCIEDAWLCDDDADCPGAEDEPEGCLGPCTPSCQYTLCGVDDGCGSPCEPGTGCAGACLSPAAQALLAAEDVDAAAHQHGKSCYLLAATAACVAEGLLTTLGLPIGCGLCFGERFACAEDHCFPVCLTDPNSPECGSCMASACDDAFETCSGLGPGGGTSCDWITGCSAACGGDPGCEQACFDGGSADAQALHGTLTTCEASSGCGDDDLCLVEHCGAEQAACTWPSQGAGSCQGIVQCLQPCAANDLMCTDACLLAATAAAQEAYLGVVTCLDTFCPPGAEAGCDGAAIQDPDQCGAWFAACLGT